MLVPVQDFAFSHAGGSEQNGQLYLKSVKSKFAHRGGDVLRTRPKLIPVSVA